MKANAEDIARRVEALLLDEGGAEVVRDFLDQMAGLMEEISREEQRLRTDLVSILSNSLGCAVPETMITADGPDNLRDFLRHAGVAAGANPPEDALSAWNRLAPRIFSLQKKFSATDSLINDIVERMYGIPQIPE